MVNLTDKEVEKIFNKIKDYHQKYLKPYDVKMPQLRNKTGYVKDALILVYLTIGFPKTKKVSKSELTQFIRRYYPDINDMQQARHLGAQKGWYIASGGRDNIVVDLKRGEYQLYSLEQPYPAFHGHRIQNTDNWEELKKTYGFRCATCGSMEGKPHLHWPDTKTKLQMAHIDPNKPLVAKNIIPQCQKCNRGDRNRWVYDERGRVIRIADPNVVKRCDKSVRRRIYKILYNEFKEISPGKL